MPISENAIRAKLASKELDYVDHLIVEAAQDVIFLDEVDAAIQIGEIIEDDEARQRCLLCANLPSCGLLHVVIDYADWLDDPTSHLLAVTVYRPESDKWIDGRIRRL